MSPSSQLWASGTVCRSCRKALQTASRRSYGTAKNLPKPEIYDVVTVGGGPVGLALLAALKSSPVTAHLRCALIETQDLSKAQSWNLPPDLYSNRASSLTPTNVSFLDSIGAWQHVDQSRVQAYDEMQVWDAANNASLQFDWAAEAVKYNAPPRTVATMTENANLTRGLLSRITELDAENALLSTTSVSSVQNGQDDVNGLNLSTWPVLSLASSSTPQSQISSPAPLAARLLIGADGFNSPVRNFAGIASHGWDYQRHGVVATLKLEPTEPSTFVDPNSIDSLFAEDEPAVRSNRATAFQRFLPALGGPIAILPLPDNHASLVWSTTPEIASKLKTLSPASFVATVNAALRLSQVDIKYMLSLPPSATNTSSDEAQSEHESELSWRLAHTPSHPRVTPPTVVSVQDRTIASFPLRFRHCTTLTSPRVALAGDAAHTIHPLAGQGLNLGLADAQSLSSTIAYAVEHGMDIGDLMTLERYGRDRFFKGLRMAGGVDALNWMYQLGAGSTSISHEKGGSSDVDGGMLGTVVGAARGLGMRIVGGLDGVKGLIMRQAD